MLTLAIHYIYSLRQGIEDGFLAPYLVHRVVTETDATGFRPEDGQLDDNGVLIPDGIYTTPDFENTLSFLPRTKAVVKHLYNFMVKYGRLDKTIVFCVNQEHADHFRREINNLNNDLVQQHPDYVVRIVSEEGDIGKGHLSRFMDIDEQIPVIVTTSRLLSTGVDVQTCKNIVIFRAINSMTEFKQIVGRGTRVREDKEKLFFTILDYTGSATRNFADPDFDGEPPLITEDEIDADGNVIEGEEWVPNPLIEDNDNWEDNDDDSDESPTGSGGETRRKYYVSDGTVSIAAESVHILDADGRLRTVQFTQYAKEHFTTMFPSMIDFREKWNDLQERQHILEELENNGISIDQLMEITKQQDIDPFDLLCLVAFDLKPLTRKQRADLLMKNKPDFFAHYSDRAKEVLTLILEKYVDFGLSQIRPDIISVEPIAQRGNPIEIVKEFGGVDEFKKAISELQTLLYADAA